MYKGQGVGQEPSTHPQDKVSTHVAQLEFQCIEHNNYMINGTLQYIAKAAELQQLIEVSLSTEEHNGE